MRVMDVEINVVFTSTLLQGEWLASRPGRFTPRKVPSVLNEYDAGLISEPIWTTWRNENSCLCRNLNSNFSVVQPLASHVHNPLTLFSTRRILNVKHVRISPLTS
jgi:hypothetical protein